MPHESLRSASRPVRLRLSHYRVIWPSHVIMQSGRDVVIMPPDQSSGFNATWQMVNGRQVLQSVQIPEDADVVVIQRPAHPLQPQMINILRSNGVAVVIDMDDDMSSIHPDNVAFHMYSDRSATPMSWKWAAMSCRIASLVTVSTERLLKVYASHGRGVVIDNYIPESYLTIPHFPTGAFGWAGTTKSHPNDPQVTAPTAEKLINEGHVFQVVGGDKKVQSAFRSRRHIPMTGSVSLREWVPMIASSIDVGWAPLAATTFNTAKSRLKALEYMAAGVAWVGSPRAEYRKLHRVSGCGLLADTPKQWYSHTKELLTNEALRKEQVEAGYAYLKDQTYEANAWRWWEAWEQASKMERKRVGLDD
jgi:hypothetical protein